jgi:hypothetical protein
MYVNFNKEKKREENTMKYETPKMTALTPAIKAIQGSTFESKTTTGNLDSLPYVLPEMIGAYVDWE